MKRHLIGIWLMCGLWVAPLQARELPDFTKLIEEYGAAVVNISTTAKKAAADTKDNTPPDHRGIPGLPEDSPFNDFFRHFFDDENEWSPNNRPATSLGSGFIISADGYVVSNNHVIEDAEHIVVRLINRKTYEAKIIGTDKRSDIALLKIDATGLPTIKLGSSKNLKVGEWVLAIGSPFGFEYSATAGIVSATGRSLPSDNYVPFIQTDVAINPGNSGGPLFNMDGEVIGVNSQIYSRTGGFMGLSFAIPVDVMNNVVEQLKTKGKVSRGWLGVLIQDVNDELAESFGMEKPQGALVAKVLPNSPAQAAGFKVGDIIVNFNDKTIEKSSELPPLVGSSTVGVKLKTTVIRQGKQMTIDVTIGELPSDDDIKLAVGKGGSKSATSDRLGISVSDLTPKDRESFNLPEGGVLVKNVSEGIANEAGIRKGDIILKVGDTDIQDVQHFKEVLDNLKAGQSVPILIHREDSPLFLALKIPDKK